MILRIGRKRVLKRKERSRRERNDTYLSSASTVRPITRQHKKPSIDGGVSLTSALSVSTVKSSKSDKSGKTSSSASSKVSVISRKPRMQPIRTYAGYQSNASSRGSLFPPGDTYQSDPSTQPEPAICHNRIQQLSEFSSFEY